MAMSGGTISFTIVIVSVQAYLLHAKSLSVSTRQSAAEDEFNSTINSSCSPEQCQLDYKEFYSTNAINSLSGNAFYYTFKTMEIPENKTGSITTADDDTIIANITDHSRFTPAGMETANKVICAQILKEFDEETNIISYTALCPWDYICDYRADRFPNYLLKARCTTSVCIGNCSPEDQRHNMCQSHSTHVTILQMRNGEWVWGQELIPIACTCTNNVMM